MTPELPREPCNAASRQTSVFPTGKMRSALGSCPAGVLPMSRATRALAAHAAPRSGGGGEGVLSAGAHHNAPDLANVAERMMPQARCSLHKTDTHTSANKADLSRDTPARPGWAAAGQFPTAGALALGAVGAAAPAACSRCSAPAAQPASPSPGLPHPPFDPEPPSKLSRPMH